ncbi:amino acid adenylation domain-containing protein [Nostoc sp. 'Peltigera membranacea cyanobiont' N6]|uniref:amino acid adenylation domain-containing protein n=1 Tax=Nostoc sp. 'Peltigera membranacea cyanobiont' N6 TaxID=1261031 RepID=UPI000CF30652|nr:non-ribosomal peptide synthetase [Nostoc sp. 'Peltigera membranacea cyanobiont' N6]AVH67903.1 non-ribosomal peptide synthetase [Nostoc sp. 'Peltigera membranacea cyanobiont' N6]
MQINSEISEYKQNTQLNSFTHIIGTQVLQEWKNTQAADRQDQCIHQIFEMQVERSPESIAVVFEDTQLTYQQLNKQANQLAHYLRALGVGPEVLVGICLERSLETIVGILGILKAGGAYVPLDPAYPPERLAFILEDTQTPVLLTQEKLVKNLPPHQAQVVCLDSDWQGNIQNSLENLVNETTADNLIYVIYTSGSTGQPKGVTIPHRGICNQLHWKQTTFGLTQADKVLLTISFSFDPSVWQIFWPLCFGGQLIVARPGGHQDTAYLVKVITEQQITVLALVPSILRVLLEEKGIENCRFIRHITCGGEALPTELIERFFAKLNLDNVLHNCYGPTEASIDSTFWTCQRGTNYTIAPIGRPITNAEIHILDENLQPVPVGESGELHIGGIGLARGYLNRPELTAEKFIFDPFSSEVGARIYKTGDLARFLPDGNIEFLGRIDYQVKIRGFRIELGEIEAILSQHPSLTQTLVIAREDVPGDKQLVAYIVAKPEQIPSQVELRRFLQGRLPEYMVPASFVFLDTLPLNPNGKIDRRALPAPHISDLGLSTNFVLPQNATEEVLASIWAKVLRLEQVGIHDNFFELGGHSLLATQVMSRVRQAFQREIPLQLLFENPTIATLAQAIAQNESQENDPQNQTIPQIGNRESVPLSFAQQRVWFLQQLQPDSRAYILSNAQRLRGKLNVSVLQQSLDAIVVHHEALRTNFITSLDGSPIQVICTPRPVELKIIEVKEEQVECLLSEEAQHLFNLESDLMLRATLLQIDQQEHILLLVMHHIASDGWSINIFWQQLAAVYEAFLSGKPSPLSKLPIQYSDFAVWQHQWLSGEKLSSQINYWKTQLAGANTVLELPTDRLRPPVQTYQGAVQSLILPQYLSVSLKEFSHQQGVTLFMTLLAAFGTVLHRYTGQEDILIGSPIAGRNQVETEELIGFFVNTLAIRTNLADNPSFRQLLSQVREVTLGAYAHQDLPFEKLVEELQPERDMSHSPLFQVMFAFHNTPKELWELPGLTITPLEVHNGAAKFELTLDLTETSVGIKGGIEYNTDLFDATTIARMLGHFQTLLEGIVANPEQHICDLPLLTAPEQHQLLVGWNNTQIDYDLSQCLHQLFEAQVEKTPDAIAVKFADKHFTYGELNNRANQLAHYLQTCGVQPNGLVAICIERSLEMVVGLLGILKAGGAYVPIDPEYPQERIAYMLGDCQAPVLLTQRDLVDGLPTSSQKVCLDTDWEMISQQRSHNPNSRVKPLDLAYVIYTSGSTGKPKGAMNSHQGICNRLLWMQDAYKLTGIDRVLQKTPFSFDVSVWEFFWPLLTGARLVMAQPGGQRDATYLVNTIIQEEITTLHFVPSMLQIFLETKGLERCQPLKRVFCSGEALPVELQERFFDRMECELHNLYGPTEAAIDVTFWQCQSESNLKSVPIGRAIANTQLYILDSHLQAVPLGANGELYIGGIGVAKGYLNRPDLTAERFISHPFKEGEKLYKTGDLVRYLPDGNIEYIGRIDHQVKIRGFRIELGEIEALIAQHPSIQQTVVTAKVDNPENQRLVAYVVPHPEQTLNTDELRQFLKQQLPEYMVPSAFVLLDTLPLTPNGKIDRRALPAPDSTRLDLEKTYLAPRDPLELQLTKIWEQILDVQPIGVRDNFFELGGHSILAVKLFWQIEKTFNKNLPLAILFQSGTIEALAKIISQEEGVVTNKALVNTLNESKSSWSSLVEIQANGSKPPFFCIHGLGGEVLCFRELALYLGSDRPFYGLQPQGLDEKHPFHRRVEDMAAHYIQEIQTLQPNGPYFLGGYSFGGVVAFEMARQLQEQGKQVGILVMLDTCLPGYSWRAPFTKRLFLHLNNIVQQGPIYLLQQVIKWSYWRKQHLQNRYKRYLENALYLPQTDKHLKIIDTNIQAMSEYVLSPYLGRAILLRTEDRYRDEAVGTQYDPQFGWSNLVLGGLDVHYIPGSHLEMLKEPHVQVLAETLRNCLTQAQSPEN